MHTLEAFHRWDASAGLILVLPEDHQPYWKMLCREIGCKVPHRIANGGETRFHSVRNGLNFLSDEIGNAAGRDEKILVAVHDGVRPFAAPEVIDRCFAEAEVSGAAIPVVLLKAYEQPYSELFTDDASVVEAFGHTVKTVPGNRENIKITTPFDLLVAKALLAK